MSDSKNRDLFPASELSKSDSKLKENKGFQTLHAKYSKPANDASIEHAVSALKAKGHKTTVVDTKEAALQVLKDLIPSSGSISSGGSTTLSEIGFTDYLKNARLGVRNFKGDAMAAMGRGEMPAMFALLHEGLNADVFFTSCSAVTENGEIVFGDGTGTRVAANTAKSLIFVVGSNKIVPTWADAEARLFDYQAPLEGARMRVAYNNPQMEGSVVHFGAIRQGEFFTPGRVHVVLIKGALGY